MGLLERDGERKHKNATEQQLILDNTKNHTTPPSLLPSLPLSHTVHDTTNDQMNNPDLSVSPQFRLKVESTASAVFLKVHKETVCSL